MCPVPGCPQMKPMKNLSNHLRGKVHKGLSDAQQEQYRRMAHQQGAVCPNFRRPIQVCVANLAAFASVKCTFSFLRL